MGFTCRPDGTRGRVHLGDHRCDARGQLYVATGILPKKYAARRQRRDESYKPTQRPKNVGIVAEEIVTRLGLKPNKTRTRIDGHQVRVVGTDMEHFARILAIAERRAARKAAWTFEWGDPDL